MHQQMMGMPGMQMGVPQQMANMPQMAMTPMAMGTPMGMMPAMGMMPMGVPMMPMGMMGMNPMMMMPGQMPAQMMVGADMSGMAPQGSQSQATSVSGALDEMAQRMVQEEANAAAAAASLPQKASSSSSRRPRIEEEDSDEEARGAKALRNVGSAAREAKKAGSGSQGAESANAEASKPTESAPSEPSEKKRCHLHMKPNPSCKVCRRIKEENATLEDRAGDQSSKPVSKEQADRDEGAKKDKEKDEAKQWTFKSSPMLKDQILKSSYFKSLLDITTVEGLIEEIHEYADNLHVYNPGSATAPSCFICQVYRLFTLPQIHAEDELQIVLHSESAVVRCVGFVYVRFVFEPAQFWSMFEEHLFDDMELKYQDPSGKPATMSIGEYVESLLIKEKYFGSPLPRIPVKVRQQLEERLAPIPSCRKRMQANRGALSKDASVEVCVDSGKWLPGRIIELFGRSSTFVKVRVKLQEDGREVTTHLGKIVLRGSSSDDSGSDASGDERRKKPRRSRSRRRGRSPDWSRWKGKSHSEMIEELRERAREDAVCGHGKVYPRRPLTFEGFATKYESSEHRPVDRESQPSFVQSRAAAQKHEETQDDEITRRLKAKAEDERLRNQRAIFEKYGKQSRPGGDAAAAYSDVDKADVLRLG